jgi:hypothetical protein
MEITSLIGKLFIQWAIDVELPEGHQESLSVEPGRREVANDSRWELFPLVFWGEMGEKFRDVLLPGQVLFTLRSLDLLWVVSLKRLNTIDGSG